MNKLRMIWCLLRLVITGCQAGERIIDLHGNDDGCNGVPHGIPCCEEKFVPGDNAGEEEIFIQAEKYISSCSHTCKSLYPNSVGITESRRQQYKSGPGRYEPKCWCEFGRGKLDSSNQGYRACMFKELSKPDVSSPSNVTGGVQAGEPPKYLMVVTSCSAVPVEPRSYNRDLGKMVRDPYFEGYQVVNTKCEADEVQGQKMGRYTLQPESYNNFSVWKKEHLQPEQYLFMSDNHHWVIGPNVTANLFGVLSEDSPMPVFPHLAEDWRFWDGHSWKEDNITVMDGENKDVGEDREVIMLDFKSIDVDNVNDSSHCCRACKDSKVVTDTVHTTTYMVSNAVMVNFDKQKKRCTCFQTLNYGWNFDVQEIVLTRNNSEITSALCDTYLETENSRRSGKYAHHPTYHYSDVQGPLGQDQRFELDNLDVLGPLFLDKIGAPLHHSSCCRECRKKYNDTELFIYRGNVYDDETKALVPKESWVECLCLKVSQTGTRPVTRRSYETYSGICEDMGPPVDCEIRQYGWSSWTDCTNLRNTCGRGFRSRYARRYQVARRGGKPCEEMDQVQSCQVERWKYDRIEKKKVLTDDCLAQLEENLGTI